MTLRMFVLFWLMVSLARLPIPYVHCHARMAEDVLQHHLRTRHSGCVTAEGLFNWHVHFWLWHPEPLPDSGWHGCPAEDYPSASWDLEPPDDEPSFWSLLCLSLRGATCSGRAECADGLPPSAGPAGHVECRPRSDLPLYLQLSILLN